MNTKGKSAQEISGHLNSKNDGRPFAAAVSWYGSSQSGRPAEANSVVRIGEQGKPFPVAMLGIDGAWYQSPGYWIACNGENPIVEVLNA